MKTLPETLIVVALFASLTSQCLGHGRLVDPASRSSAWRFGFKTPANYDDNQLNCGGYGHQWSPRMGGKCGLCGDPYDSNRPNEAGGRYANGIIVKQYISGQTIDVTVQITANHLGWFEFRLCPNNNPQQRITQECLDSNLLEMTAGGTRFRLGSRLGRVTVQLKLPTGLVCTQCVLQWKWNAGNNWGVSKSGRACVGCGPQEQFYGCADVAITGATGSRGHDVTSWPRPQTETRTPPPVRTGRIQRKNNGGGRDNEESYSHSVHGEETVTTATRRCRAVGIWARQRNMNTWCQNNCDRGYCPASHCTC